MSFGIFETILCVLFTALIVSVLFRRLQIPVIVGYLIVGALLGPHGIGLMPDVEAIKKIAEFGIVLLMFSVGLEFSQPKLFALKKAVFVIGGLQVLLSVGISIVIGTAIGMDSLSALIVGSIVAMSSTAIVVKQLDDQFELYTTHGMNALGVLLFQDLAVIPFIILIVSLSSPHHAALPTIFFWVFIKGATAILLMSILGRWLLRPFFRLIAKTHALELFTLTVLLISLTAAWITNVFGLSYSLGAFLAGIMLSETEFRHQIEIEISPFRDILLGLFFITIGMLANITAWPDIWHWIVLLVFALTIGKMLLVFIISRLAKLNYSVALRTGLVLGQGGEFGFAILTLAVGRNMLPPGYGQVILAALLLSIAISPLFIYFNKSIADWLLPKSLRKEDELIQQHITKQVKELNEHIIICGYGRVGQQVAKILGQIHYDYIGLDIDPELIKQASLAGDHVLFGDASHPGILKAAGIARAKAVIISFDKLKPAKKVLSMVKEAHPTLPIFVRCKDQYELEELKKYQPTKMVAETFEESLMLSQFLLQTIKVPSHKISALMEKARNKDYEILRKTFSNPFSEELWDTIPFQEALIPILIPKGAYAINHHFNEFNFHHLGVEVVAIRRGKANPIKPDPHLKFHPNDILIVYGSYENIEEVERVLFEGN